jgi:hypothetical protein
MLHHAVIGNLHGDFVAAGFVAGFVHGTHAAMAEPFQHGIRSDRWQRNESAQDFLPDRPKTPDLWCHWQLAASAEGCKSRELRYSTTGSKLPVAPCEVDFATGA